MSSIPTVRIVDPGESRDFIIINESDFDPEVHELYEEPGEDSENPENPPQDPQEPAVEANDPSAGQEDPPADDASEEPAHEAAEETPDEPSEAAPLPDLRGVTVSEGRLAAAVAEIEDVEVLEKLRTSDNRTSAGPVYEARIAELTALEEE